MAARRIIFLADDEAFELPTVGLVQPNLILVVTEDENVIAVLNLAANLPQVRPAPPGLPLPQGHQPPNNEDSLNLESIMAGARDLRSFQELEGYFYRAFDAESDAPEDSASESDDDDDATNYASESDDDVSDGDDDSTNYVII